MGGTDPSNNPAGRLGGSNSCFFLRFLFGLFGCGDATRGVGGLEVCRMLGSVEAGGVGIGLFEVAECFVSEAEES